MQKIQQSGNERGLLWKTRNFGNLEVESLLKNWVLNPYPRKARNINNQNKKKNLFLTSKVIMSRELRFSKLMQIKWRSKTSHVASNWNFRFNKPSCVYDCHQFVMLSFNSWTFFSIIIITKKHWSRWRFEGEDVLKLFKLGDRVTSRTLQVHSGQESHASDRLAKNLSDLMGLLCSRPVCILRGVSTR